MAPSQVHPLVLRMYAVHGAAVAEITGVPPTTAARARAGRRCARAAGPRADAAAGESARASRQARANRPAATRSPSIPPHMTAGSFHTDWRIDPDTLLAPAPPGDQVRLTGSH